MTLIRNAVAGMAPAIATACLRIEGMPRAVRVVVDPTATIFVIAAPITSTREVLTALGPVHGEAFTYGLVRSMPGRMGTLDLATRIGSTERSPGERLRRHLSNPPVPGADEFFIVAGRTPGILTPELARGLEAQLARQALLAARFSVIGSYMHPSLTASAQGIIGHWIEQLRVMLADAGMPILVRAESTPRIADAGIGPLRSGYSLDVPDSLVHAPERTRWELRKGEVVARATCVGDTVVIEAGARARKTPVPSHQACLKRKFAELLERKVFKTMPGCDDLVEAVRPFCVPSLINGARLMVGTNAPATLWRRID